MKYQPKHLEKKESSERKHLFQKITMKIPAKVIAIAVAVILLVVVAIGAAVYFFPRLEEEAPGFVKGGWVEYLNPGQPTPEPTPEPTLEPAVTMLPEMAELYAQNNDLAGWITIEDTKIDYPVMYAPDEYAKYLYADFNGKYSGFGSIFIDEACTYDPLNENESDNLLFHGHNMRDGSMFRGLLKYEKKNYWEEHPIVKFSTLYENREYEIIAALYDRIYYTHETHFRYYQFIDAADEAAFNEAITYFKEHSIYDTGKTAEYGDRLITLSTCSYHTDNGRFIVVAREIVKDDAVAATPAEDVQIQG